MIKRDEARKLIAVAVMQPKRKCALRCFFERNPGWNLRRCPDTGMACIRCAKPCATRLGKRCPFCAEYSRVYQLRRYHSRKAAGLCQRCINPAEEGKVLCQSHREGETISREEHRVRRHAPAVEKALDKKVMGRLLTILRRYGPARVDGQYDYALDVVNLEVYGDAL